MVPMDAWHPCLLTEGRKGPLVAECDIHRGVSVRAGWPTGLNLRIAPNDGLECLTFAVLLAPPLDDTQACGMRSQTGH
jgi:hypothetical protein